MGLEVSNLLVRPDEHAHRGQIRLLLKLDIISNIVDFRLETGKQLYCTKTQPFQPSIQMSMPNFTPIDLGPSIPEEITTGTSARLYVKMYRQADDANTEATTDIELARKTLGQLNVADLNAYKEFLKDPPPEWVSRTKWPRSDPRYRPFTGPLSDASRRQAIIAVKGLMGFAEQTGYVRRNPGALVRNVRAPSASRITRYLTQGAIALALETVARRPADTPAAAKRRERDRFLFVTFTHTGARLNEIVSASMGSIYTDTAATLRQASAHWLRHSMLTNHANNGVQLKTLQDTAACEHPADGGIPAQDRQRAARRDHRIREWLRDSVRPVCREALIGPGVLYRVFTPPGREIRAESLARQKSDLT